MKVERVENMCGGKGHVIIKHILGEKELNGKCGLYAEVVIEPGCYGRESKIIGDCPHL